MNSKVRGKEKKNTTFVSVTIFQPHPICTPTVIILTAAVLGCRANVCNDVNTWSQLDEQAQQCVSQQKLRNEQIFALISLGNICSLTSVSLLQGEEKHLHSIRPILPPSLQHRPASTPLLYLFILRAALLSRSPEPYQLKSSRILFV